MLDIEKIRKLVEMMVANDLVEISLRDGEEEVNLRRPNPHAADLAPELLVRPNVSHPAPAEVVAAGAPAAAETAALPAEDSEANLQEICSPMVGTFYTASDPDAAPYVSVGQQIQAGMVVCILEAMKVFNEIKSEIAGTVERILVKNAQPVEYGQPLFLVRPQ